MTRTALVTGASRGIGKAVVQRLLADGVRVCGLYRTEGEAAELLAKELEAASPKGIALQCDISDEQQVHAAVARCAEEFGGIDVLVNNAGVTTFALLENLERVHWDSLFATNVTGPYLVTRAVLPLMGPGASIVTITSGLGITGAPGKTHYAASKAALIGFTKALSREVGRRDIRVNAIAPGIIETEMSAVGLNPELKARYEGQCALGRIGQSPELAEVVAFLADHRSSYVNGQTLMVDGGM
ncbi:SDR family NAD(P)-dependent oxidoreductase [Kutzneria sp. 744]|uniref:SDR family NAD(P)-dependent oxidoreductase n=1 Tax=Kutzneria sp. (strain 744) TaxID=345341 RepID=UPI0003EEB8ED|nr:SDR family NAD(P)-dependent oxidoreductase [Kutzneria sp. 744]EWM13574.1 3-oxoacyl-[acyl-carrier-protein] reductase [Kutzneria sp. 744]